MTPLDSMRLTASDPENARRAVEEILFATFGARPPEHDELQVVLGALEAVAADVRRRLAAIDAQRAVEAAEGRRVLDLLAQEPRP